MKRIISIALSIVILALSFSAFSVSSFAAENNSYATAKKINVNETVYDTSSFAEDHYFKFTIPADGYVNIRANHNYDSTSQTISLISYNGNTSKLFLEFVIGVSEEWDETFHCGLKKGTYFVVVEGGYSDSPYNFIVNYTKSDSWEKENSNDTIKTDNTINLNSYVYGSITPYSDDEDYFRFTTNKDGYIQLTFNHEYGSNSHTAVFLSYDGNEETHIYRCYISSSSETQSSDKFYLDSGTYYIMVEGGVSEYNFKIITVSKPTTTKTTVKQTTTTTQKSTTTTKPTSTTTADIPTTEIPTYTQPADIEYEDEEIYEFENFQYIFVDTTIIIVNYFGNDEYVVIPDKIDDVIVIGIGANAFSQSSAKEFEIPATVKQFGNNALGEDEGKKVIHCPSGSAAEAYAMQNGLQIANNIDIEINNDTDDSEDGANKPDNMKTIILVMCVVVAVAIIVCIVMLLAKKNKS